MFFFSFFREKLFRKRIKVTNLNNSFQNLSCEITFISQIAHINFEFVTILEDKYEQYTENLTPSR